MQYLQWNSISSILLSIYTAHCVIAETYHIVTSLNSPCPGEYIGEPCLTLQQYAASPSQDSNVTLLIESGTHRLLQNVAELTTRADYFTMMSASGQGHKDAHNVIVSPRPIYYYYYSGFSDVREIHISGIHFLCTTGSICTIRMRNVQQLFIKDCTFQGVKLDLDYNIANVVIFQTCFYDGSSLSTASTSSTINITRSIFSNNTQAVYFYTYSALTVSESTFINNTAYRGGAAMYIRVSSYHRVLINTSIFVNNTGIIEEGGALYLVGDSNANTVYITRCTFIYNSANSNNCGAISARDINVNITDSDFYYNRANGDGGVACIRSANIDISKSTFVQNSAVGNGGAFLLDESNIYINSTLFKNNRAGQDGGALATYVYPSTYAIIQSTFIDNHAEDDGGAVFIGCAESILRVGMSTFNNYHAIDRGGAIAIYGSRVVMIATNVYNNMADLGNSMCTCSSEVNTSFSADGQRDTTQPECINYDTNINYHNLPLVQEQGYPDIIHLSTKYGETACSLSMDNSLYGELRKASATAYTAVTISVTLALALLLYIIITKALQYHMTQQTASDEAAPADDRVDPLYEEARDYTSSKTDTRDIEMMPNVVYGKQTTN